MIYVESMTDRAICITKHGTYCAKLLSCMPGADRGINEKGYIIFKFSYISQIGFG